MNNRPPAPSNGSVGRNSLHSHHHRPHLPQRTSRDFDGDNNDDSPSTNNGINTGSYGSSPPKSRQRPYHSRGGGSFGGERACYNCGGSGHMARDCPEPRNERSGGGGRDAAAPPPPPPPPPPPRDYRRGNQHSSSFHSSDQQQRHGQTPSNFDRPNSNYQKSPHNSNIMQQTPSPPNLYNSHPNTPHHQQQQHQQNQNAPIPPDMRRTLILSNVPPHLSFKDIMKFFGRNWNAQIQFAHVDKTTGDAYVKFAQSQDARRVWEEGRADGLDGRLVDNAGGSEGNELSLAAEGVGLKAFHFNNKIITSNEDGPNNSNDGFDRKRSWGQSGDRGQQREIGAGGRPYSQPNKAPRYTSEGNDVHSHNAPSMPGTTYQPYDQYDGSNPPPPPSHPLTADTNSHLRHQNPHKQHQQLPLHHNKLSPLQIQALQQKDEEQQLQWQKFQKEEEEWRQRRYAEYQTFLESQRQRTAQVSKFEEKRDLLTKQESMLAKQLPLHKKILQMLKTKKASVSEQSSKMKEILSTQTRITELKKETKELVEGLETLKEEEKEKGVFIPSEKRPVFAGVGGGSALGKRSLDRRTTVLKVEGFEEVSGLNENNVEGKEIREGNATETALKEHFSTCGIVSCVTVKNVDNEDSRPYALVDFVNRIDAERAKASDTKFNGNSLTFKWHHQSSISATSGINPDDEVDASNLDQFDETYTDDNLYNDIDGAYDGGEYSAEVEAAPQFRHEGDDEHMVDYDYEDEGYDED